MKINWSPTGTFILREGSSELYFGINPKTSTYSPVELGDKTGCHLVIFNSIDVLLDFIQKYNLDTDYYKITPTPENGALIGSKIQVWG